ncbi:hypothetical protein DL98DRAFT_519699 [Cadophora sp. DSE1049]|nr:hypothetical protein DL98DRAFT_519699 [Cadophora sp. DSE1049]
MYACFSTLASLTALSSLNPAHKPLLPSIFIFIWIRTTQVLQAKPHLSSPPLSSQNTASQVRPRTTQKTAKARPSKSSVFVSSLSGGRCDAGSLRGVHMRAPTSIADFDHR